MDRRTRPATPHRAAAIVAFVTTTAMGLISAASFSQVTADGRPIVAAATAVGVAAGVAAGVLLLRGSVRLAASLLLVSVITPTYFAAAINVVPLVLGLVLLVGSFRPDPRPGATSSSTGVSPTVGAPS